MAHIHDCPVELLQVIIAAACSYDLRTACALRLVDRRISTLCAPLRFNEVAASGEEELHALLYSLNAADPADVHIRRLFICDRAQNEADETSEFVTLGAVNVIQEAKEVKRRNREDAAKLEKVIAEILPHAASHVQSLCLLGFNPAFAEMLNSFGNLAFPRLEDLTLRLVAGARMQRDWRATMPELRALTLRFPPSFGLSAPVLISRLAHGGELIELTFVDYEPTPWNNAAVRVALAGNDVYQLERMEIHPIGSINNVNGMRINEAALDDLRSISAANIEQIVVREVMGGRASYETWRERWTSTHN